MAKKTNTLNDIEAEVKALRSDKLSKEMIETFCVMIERGDSADAVCDFLSIPNGRYHSWLRKGEEYLDGGTANKKYVMYALFVLSFKRAFAAYRVGVTRNFHSNFRIHWQKDLAILERRDSKTWAKNAQAGQDNESYDPDQKFL